MHPVPHALKFTAGGADATAGLGTTYLLSETSKGWRGRCGDLQAIAGPVMREL